MVGVWRMSMRLRHRRGHRVRPLSSAPLIDRTRNLTKPIREKPNHSLLLRVSASSAFYPRHTSLLAWSDIVDLCVSSCGFSLWARFQQD